MVRKEITVAGVTSIWNTEYTPTLRSRSWAIDTMAPMAIFHSSRMLMYSMMAMKK